MKPRTPHFHFDIISGLKRPNMKREDGPAPAIDADGIVNDLDNFLDEPMYE